MNIPAQSFTDALLVAAGSDSTQLGSGSIGLIAAPFVPTPSLTLAEITEASYTGYARQGIGNPTVTFTGADGNEYVEGNTVRFQPTGSSSVNNIYGSFTTPGSSTTTMITAELFPAPIPLAGPSNQITITPRYGLNPLTGMGNNIVSN